MNIRNIALVRATNIIPIDGIVRPLSEVPYLCKEEGTYFYYSMYDLIRNKGLLKEVDWTKLDEMSEIDKENAEFVKKYMPYSSDYNSMILWSLNGLVPDDINNVFSNKTCAIIEGLEEQIDQSEIVSLVPTDTAIRRNVKLSENAIILILKERYDSLSAEEKEQLSKLDLTVKMFEGDLKEAIDEELIKTERFTAETLSLRREDDGYVKSDTSDEVRKVISDIANKKNIAQILHWHVLTGKNDNIDSLKNVGDEFDNALIVKDFYKKTFFNYLFSKMEIDNKIKRNAMYSPEASPYMKALCEEIDRIGLDEYKVLVDVFNKTLENLKEKDKLPTPQNIVDLANDREREGKDLKGLEFE